MRWGFWSVLAGLALLLTIGSASIPLTDPDESRFARTSVEMLQSGDPVVPTFEGRPRLVKPPLVHWIQGAVFRACGVSPLTARLHAVLASLGSLILVAAVARRRFGDEGALWAAAVLGTTPLFLLSGRIGTLDSLLALHVWAIVAFDLQHRELRGGAQAWITGGLLGLAFLTKGPVGIVLPLLVLLAGRTFSGREVLPSLRAFLQALGAWSVVVLPWGLALTDRMGVGSVWSTLRTEALERYFAGTVHVEPVWFYAPVLLLAVLPWSGPLVSALVRLIRERHDSPAPTARYAAGGLIAGTLFLSLSRGKLPSYILPLMPLAALLVTWELNRQLQSSPSRGRLGPWTLVITLLFAGVGLGVAAARLEEPAYARAALLGAICINLGAAVALVGAVRGRPRLVFGAAGAAGWLFLVLVLVFAAPEISRTRTSAHLLREVPELESGRPVVVVDMKLPSLTFYLGHPPEQVDMVLLGRRLAREDDALFVFDRADLVGITPSPLDRLQEVGHQGKYVVFERRSDP